MAEEGYLSSAWESGDQSDFQTSGGHGRPQLRTFESAESSSSSPPITSSPIPRSSVDSAGRSSTTRWQESPPGATSERRDTLTAVHSDATNLVEPTFDENVLRALCEMDCGVPLLLDRIKQSTISCREASVFFKKRAAMEEEYGKNMQKLARSTAETYSMNDGKAGSFVNAWQATMRVHELMAENRLRFAQRLNEMSEELAVLTKEVDKNRKQTKELAQRYERALQESEAATEKSKNRLDITSEELERVLLQKEGESLKDNAVQGRVGGAGGKRVIGKAVAKGGLLLKGKNPGNIQRQEDDIRSRMSAASDMYRKAVTDTQAMRQEYFNFQLPRILRSLKECADEMDLGTQYHLTRYAFLFESIVLSDGTILVPPREEGLGLKASIETIDNRGDFRVYMQHYAYARGGAIRGPRREGPSEEGFLPPLPRHESEKVVNVPSNGVNGVHDKGRPTFGVDLAEQMTRDNVEIPLIMVKCCQAIEKYGMQTQGIYRISGTTSKVAKLRQRLDQDLESVDLDTPEWSGDISNVASVLKQWLRDLPDPLLTLGLHQGFIEAAKIENDRLRHIRLHERVNELPDPNYATLKYFLGHLHRINQQAAVNQMSMQNLAIVFGPTLFGVVPGSGQGNGGMADATLQNLAIETILNHYNDIFIDESESAT
ncbi:putative fes/CIP4, and EFC/F-BAR homology domain containing protein [Lyophyllum shimeji]|uniref:Fes/CIP4, and EFC/F-BAR homology domain containing protein n=1 Tax=Lyophyllum shimeji TaxID=47721 RepID=A0A9P3UQ04_LYOSH|nr:putative fes/CIP4, and EFC/F-BAR homology domain containing protein [Lyophyllum shimeji]